MTIFWILVAAMLVLAAIFIFWPLLFSHNGVAVSSESVQKQENIDLFKQRLSELELEKSQGTLTKSSFEQLKIELEKTLLKDVSDKPSHELTGVVVNPKYWQMTALITLLVMFSSLIMYSILGRSDDYVKYLVMKDQGTLVTESDAPGSDAPGIEEAIIMLEAKLKQDPEDVGKLFLLANSYSAMGQHTKAAEVFTTIEKLIGSEDPKYPAVKGAYAQALFQASGEKITDQVQKAIDQALRADPEESNALILLGISAYQQADFTMAANYWERSRVNAGPAQIEQFINPAIAAAREKAGLEVQPELASAAQSLSSEVQPGTTKEPVQITVNLDMSPELKKQVSGQSTVFVFARPHGGRMPLAAQRIQVKDLPISIVLDDTQAVMPTAKLSSVEVVDITARVSLSGQPAAQPGDFFVTQEQVKVENKAQPLLLIIDQIVK